MASALLQVERLHKRFAVAGRRGALLHAVDDVSFTIGAGESVGLVGESGCGKSTLARLLTMIETPTAGALAIDGTDVTTLNAAQRYELRRAVQIVLQNPYGSLNPRQTVADALEAPLLLHGMTDAQ